MCHIHPRWRTAVKRAPFMACWRVEWVRARLGTGAEPWRCPDQGAWGVPPVGRAAHVRLPVSAGSWCRMAV